MTQPLLVELAPVLREFALSLVRESPPSSLTRTAAATLSVLDRFGPQRITTLSNHESVSQPAMTGLVQRLEAAGLVVRDTDPADRRAALISITPSGTEAVTELRRRHDDTITDRLTRLSPDQLAALAAALPAIVDLTENHAELPH